MTNATELTLSERRTLRALDGGPMLITGLVLVLHGLVPVPTLNLTLRRLAERGLVERHSALAWAITEAGRYQLKEATGR